MKFLSLFFVLASALLTINTTLYATSVAPAKPMSKAKQKMISMAKQLIKAIDAKDPEAVIKLIGQGVLAQNPNNSFLHYAASKGNIPICSLLLQETVYVDLVDNQGYTPLTAAICSNQTIAAELLINYGHANVNKMDRALGYTPLIWAVIRNNVDLVQLLITTKADVNQPDAKNITPLEFAIARGHKEIEQLLINAGAQPIKPATPPLEAINFAKKYGFNPIDAFWILGPYDDAPQAKKKAVAAEVVIDDGFQLHIPCTKIAQPSDACELPECNFCSGAITSITDNHRLYDTADPKHFNYEKQVKILENVLYPILCSTFKSYAPERAAHAAAELYAYKFAAALKSDKIKHLRADLTKDLIQRFGNPIIVNDETIEAYELAETIIHKVIDS